MPFPARPEMWFLAYAALAYAAVLGALLGRTSRVRRGRGVSPAPLLVRVALLCWLTAVLFLAREETFVSGGPVYRAIVPLVAAEAAVVAFLAFSPGVGRWCRAASPGLLTALQGFRLGADAFLAWRGQEGASALGAIAAVVCVLVSGAAFLSAKGSPAARARMETGLLVANTVGFAAWLVTAFVVFGEGSGVGGFSAGSAGAPGADGGPSTWWAFPWILLPAFHLPLGVALHVLAFRCLASKIGARRALAA